MTYPAQMSAEEFRKTFGAPNAAKPRKYGNKPIEAGGIKFGSQKECRHHMGLVKRLAAGEIRNLRHEPPFQYTEGGKVMFTIKPDHVWEERNAEGNWRQRIADTKCKATMTPVWRLKKKLFEARWGIEIEVWE